MCVQQGNASTRCLLSYAVAHRLTLKVLRDVMYLETGIFGVKKQQGV